MKDNFFLLEKEIRRIDQKLVIQFKDFISKLLQTYNTNEVKIVVEELYVLNLKHREIDKEFFIKYFPIAQLVVNTSNISNSSGSAHDSKLFKNFPPWISFG